MHGYFQNNYAWKCMNGSTASNECSSESSSDSFFLDEMLEQNISMSQKNDFDIVEEVDAQKITSHSINSVLQPDFQQLALVKSKNLNKGLDNTKPETEYLEGEPSISTPTSENKEETVTCPDLTEPGPPKLPSRSPVIKTNFFQNFKLKSSNSTDNELVSNQNLKDTKFPKKLESSENKNSFWNMKNKMVKSSNKEPTFSQNNNISKKMSSNEYKPVNKLTKQTNLDQTTFDNLTNESKLLTLSKRENSNLNQPKLPTKKKNLAPNQLVKENFSNRINEKFAENKNDKKIDCNSKPFVQTRSLSDKQLKNQIKKNFFKERGHQSYDDDSFNTLYQSLRDFDTKKPCEDSNSDQLVSDNNNFKTNFPKPKPRKCNHNVQEVKVRFTSFYMLI